jgi:hypothetical protein
MSGYSQRELPAEGLDPRVLGVLAKPFTAEVLEQAVRPVLGG